MNDLIDVIELFEVFELIDVNELFEVFELIDVIFEKNLSYKLVSKH